MRIGIMQRLLRIRDGVRDLLFPPRCAGCDELLPPIGKDVFCPVCRASWETGRLVAIRRQTREPNDHLYYLVPYRSGRETGVPERFIYRVKHEGNARLFAFAAHTLAHGVQIRIRGEGDEPSSRPLITYPPRRRAAISEDGFDQAARLAKALAGSVNGDFAPLFRRTGRPTSEQKHLTAGRRRENATAAYALKRRASHAVQGRTVILCDDVCTTGATLTACEEHLLAAGAARVLWVTIAKTGEYGAEDRAT